MKKLSLPILMIAALLALSSCNFPTNASTATVAPMDAINTAAAQTVIAMSTALAASSTPGPNTDSPTQAPQNTPVPSTNLPVVTLAPVLSSTPVSDNIPTVCDRVKFVKDVTIPDDTAFAPNESFTKTWRLQNAGTCTWNSNYRLVFDNGDVMSGPVSTSLPGTVTPGQEIDVSVNLKAPGSAGKYKGYWKIQNAAGQSFGYGDGNKAFWVLIDVGITPETFAVTSIDLSVDHDNVVATCPYSFTFNFQVRTSAEGTISYYLERSDGLKTKTYQVDINQGETKTVSRPWSFDSSFNGWVKVYIDNPNHQSFGHLNVNLDCQ